MSQRAQDWAERVAAGDRRSIARAITAVESGDPAGVAVLKLLFRKAGRAYVIGITGSPGAGKSTLVEKLAAAYRSAGERVGIIAVDPSSPFSGGAILGDRIRMQRLSTDQGVYIRSMATRGHLGGLASATEDVATILDAAGCGVILVETVGVGQDEVEVARHADVTALLLVPGMGDDVQTFKAGVMEIADVFVINKSDRPGAERVEQELIAMLSLAARKDGWRPPIVKTVATTGEGVEKFHEALVGFREFSAKGPHRLERQREQWRARLVELLKQRLFEEVAADRLREHVVEEQLEEILARRTDPYSVVEEVIEDFLLARGPARKARS